MERLAPADDEEPPTIPDTAPRMQLGSIRERRDRQFVHPAIDQGNGVLSTLNQRGLTVILAHEKPGADAAHLQAVPAEHGVLLDRTRAPVIQAVGNRLRVGGDEELARDELNGAFEHGPGRLDRVERSGRLQQSFTKEAGEALLDFTGRRVR